MPEPPGGDHDAVRVSHPCGARGPKVVWDDLTEPGILGGVDETTAETVVALVPVDAVRLSAGEQERVGVVPRLLSGIWGLGHRSTRQ